MGGACGGRRWGVCGSWAGRGEVMGGACGGHRRGMCGSWVGLLTGLCCRFDMEQTQSQEEVEREKSLREKLGIEKDRLTGEVLSLRQQLEVLCMCVYEHV